MASRSATLLALTLTLPLAFACSDPPTREAEQTAGDDSEATFGGVALKADGRFTDCELLEVLKVVNESTSDVPTLQALGLRANAAAAIVTHRHGPDAQAGTADDDVFDGLDELDAIPFVGPVTLDALVASVRPRCEPDLASRPYIDSTTFDGNTGGGWARDNVELEGAMSVTGLTGARLRAILTTKDAAGRTEYDRMRKTASFEAFSADFGLDEMPWDAASHGLRESFPYTVLSIEGERFAVDQATHRRELTLGTDKMDDTYYDTADFQLLKHGMVLRARARWDSDAVVRRLLIGAKFDTGIDPDGIKRTDKLDIRTEGEQHLATLDQDIRRGKVKWSFEEAPVEPVKVVYEKLAAFGVLPDIGGKADVLLLDPKVRLRSLRSRFHLNEARIETVRRMYEHGRVRMQELAALMEAAAASGRIPADLQAAADAVGTLAKGVADGSLVRARALSAAQAVRPEVSEAEIEALLPGGSAPSDGAGLELRKAVSEAVDALYHEIGDPLDEVERELIGAMDTRFDAYVEPLMLFAIERQPGLGVNRTPGPFLPVFDGLDPGQGWVDFNAFLEARKASNADGFRELTSLADADWPAVRLALQLADLKVARRQIEYAGTLARALWFDQARQLYVPASDRAWGNFLIDTFDWTDMVTEQEWQSIPEAERTIATPVPPEKVLHTVLVNELQIELGAEKAYVDRVRELETQIAAGSTPELETQLAGAKFVFSTYRALLTDLAELKGERVLRRLRRAGAPAEIEWKTVPDSKGNIALKIVADRD